MKRVVGAGDPDPAAQPRNGPVLPTPARKYADTGTIWHPMGPKEN